MSGEPRPTIRLDKWLWQARFFKSRSLAAGVVGAGKVRVGGQPVSKPSRSVGPQDVLTFPQGKAVRVVRILEIGTRRGPATEAQALYEDLSPPPPPKTPENPRYEGKGRPTGKQRRDMQKGVFGDEPGDA
ncbi:RNA-binding S4 domain-containing protein [Pelagovum pacificum]|uniref:RNA-binding S4 domain-containing protein n=1 Tax=Pelagovum pacificum TaxID=2588711 RepID=A0A5C5GGV6_9RHOB|nr:RNA-binding S4 domain-containing protein [Pelagovum pacificum]QQA43698.1 RNA-binding S4 domain-containing protein [Pelagovum pacificum]TNY33171.1 RNA-binding S4 domain-containing protein [Pelagovum pacificum]